MLRIPAPEENHNQIENSHFLFKWNFPKWSQVEEKEESPRTQRAIWEHWGREVAERKPNHGKGGLLPGVVDDDSRVSQTRGRQQETSDEGLSDPNNWPLRGKEVCCLPGRYSHQVWFQHTRPGSGFKQSCVNPTPSMPHAQRFWANLKMTAQAVHSYQSLSDTSFNSSSHPETMVTPHSLIWSPRTKAFSSLSLLVLSSQIQLSHFCLQSTPKSACPFSSHTAETLRMPNSACCLPVIS